jgi:hypothetical protein
MKNILELLKEFGLEIPEDKKKDFEKSVLENYKTIADYENQKEKLDKASNTIKVNDTALEDLKKQLEGFKDVDVTALNKRIQDLETEKGELEKDYSSKISERDFTDILNGSITASNGKNAKAITALLDLDALKSSKNQKEDITSALKALSEADDSKMLFGVAENKVGSGSPIGNIGNSTGNSSESMRKIMGLPTTEGDK